MNKPLREYTPQKFDAIIRTVTASAIAISLVFAMIYLAITQTDDATAQAAAVAAVYSAGLLVVGFYFGGHTAQNTAALEEARLTKTSEASEASAVRSEASAVRSEKDHGIIEKEQS